MSRRGAWEAGRCRGVKPGAGEASGRGDGGEEEAERRGGCAGASGGGSGAEAAVGWASQSPAGSGGVWGSAGAGGAGCRDDPSLGKRLWVCGEDPPGVKGGGGSGD